MGSPEQAATSGGQAIDAAFVEPVEWRIVLNRFTSAVDRMCSQE
jgi:hypothetical protein